MQCRYTNGHGVTEQLQLHCLTLLYKYRAATASHHCYWTQGSFACRLWDWKSGNCFQQHATQVQPGSLESEAGIFAMTFDKSGGRLICAEADKTIKMYKEDEQATPETHPVSFRPPKDIRRF